jgi:hypothetical protein
MTNNHKTRQDAILGPQLEQQPIIPYRVLSRMAGAGIGLVVMLAGMLALAEVDRVILRPIADRYTEAHHAGLQKLQ